MIEHGSIKMIFSHRINITNLKIIMRDSIKVQQLIQKMKIMMILMIYYHKKHLQLSQNRYNHY